MALLLAENASSCAQSYSHLLSERGHALASDRWKSGGIGADVVIEASANKHRANQLNKSECQTRVCPGRLHLIVVEVNFVLEDHLKRPIGLWLKHTWAQWPKLSASSHISPLKSVDCFPRSYPAPIRQFKLSISRLCSASRPVASFGQRIDPGIAR